MIASTAAVTKNVPKKTKDPAHNHSESMLANLQLFTGITLTKERKVCLRVQECRKHEELEEYTSIGILIVIVNGLINNIKCSNNTSNNYRKKNNIV